jgi:CubicO group peptidase (beta-lactamase class C family)
MPTQGNRLTRRSVLKYLAASTGFALLDELDLIPAGAQTPPNRKLPRASAESAGISPEAVLAFIAAVEQRVGGLHSFMLLRHGKVAAEGWWAPYAPPLPHMLYSLSKSFTSTAVGLAVAEGRLTVEDRVISFFPDRRLEKRDDHLAAMQVKHLLTMNTGHDQDTTGPTTAAPDGDWVRAFLSLPVEHAPGSKFVYNSAATYMCSAIVQKLTGITVLDYLKPRLFGPLGITGMTWEICPKGVNTGGWGLNVKTEDIARFGQLYLQKGRWNDKQILPASWVEEATSKQVSNGSADTASDWTQGYGYQFWRCRNNAYRGDGAFGQYCVVLPEQGAVLAITSGVGDMQAVLNAVWDHLLPGMRSAAGPSDAGAALKQRLAKLEVRAPEGSPVSAAAGRVSGKTYRMDPNTQKMQSAVFAFSPDRGTVTLRGEAGEQRIVSGHRKWMQGMVPGTPSLQRLGFPPVGKIAARGAWTDPDTYTMKVCYLETPYVESITCRFSGEEVTVSRKLNVSFGPAERPTLVGRAV